MGAHRLSRPNHRIACGCVACQRYRHAERVRLYREKVGRDIDERALEAYWRLVACSPEPLRWPSTASSWGEV